MTKVGSFATDQTLSDGDLALLAAAQRGDKQSLRTVCSRFHTPLLALALRSTGDWEYAAKAVEPLLDHLCRELLARQLAPNDWAARAAQLAAEIPAPIVPAADDGSGLEGLGSIPRVVRRRALRRFLPQLPLDELLALLLRYAEHRSPEQMAGLVAADAQEAGQVLITVHRKAQALLDLQENPREVP